MTDLLLKVVCVTLFSVLQVSELSALRPLLAIVQPLRSHLMQPLQKDGRYSYPDDPGHPTDGTHEHYTWRKALMTVARDKCKGWFKKPQVENEMQADPVALFKPTQTVPRLFSIEPKITCMGHASVLIQMNGLNVLTDPIAGSMQHGLGKKKRAMPVGIKLEDMPPIDGVVISHSHPDHMDEETIKDLYEKHKPMFYVPNDNGKYLEEMGVPHSNIVEMGWWEDTTLAKNDRLLTLTCLPARHWSIRFNPSDCCKSLWASWMISSQNKNIYFAGDSAYGKHFGDIGQQFPSIDLALMPIGPTEEHNTRRHDHLDAIQAVDEFETLGAKRIMPIHFGVFFKGPNTVQIPYRRLHEYWKEQKEQGNLVGKKLLFPQCGKEYALEDSDELAA